MMLDRRSLVARLTILDSDEGGGLRPLLVVPRPDIEQMEADNEASIGLRLGRWFKYFRPSRIEKLDISEPDSLPSNEARITKQSYIPFGEKFLLHPNQFVLGATLEWIGLPEDLGGYVTGKSSWGRRGLIIETAAGIHPGFSGCLTLEITNLGEIPIVLAPGMPICQIFFHRTEPCGLAISQFSARRKPGLGQICADKVVLALKKAI